MKIGGRRARTSFLQGLPWAKDRYRAYLPLMPLAIEQLDVSAYDVVISSSHAVAKGVLTGPNQLHISYVHSPIRYAWDMQHQYLREANLDRGPRSWLARWMLHRIRLWDTRTANGVDQFLCNSRFISRRIRKAYGRDSILVYPPVDTERFELVSQKDEFYITASRLVPYKRVDLIVRAFSRMPERKLIVVGDGPESDKIRALAGENVSLLGYRADDELRTLMGKAQAFVFAAEEDFGIVPVEAQACGTPVIAFGRGGALETVIAGGKSPTGVFFREQNVESVCEAVRAFEQNRLDFRPEACRANAERFSTARFRDSIRAVVSRKMQERALDDERGAVV